MEHIATKNKLFCEKSNSFHKQAKKKQTTSLMPARNSKTNPPNPPNLTYYTNSFNTKT